MEFSYVVMFQQNCQEIVEAFLLIIFYLDLVKKMMILVISLFKTKLISKGYIVRLTNGELKTKPLILNVVNYIIK